MSASSIASSTNAKQHGGTTSAPSSAPVRAGAGAIKGSGLANQTASSSASSSLTALANPPAPNHHGIPTNAKPVLNGVRMKARKADKKATKHDASAFKEQLVNALQPVIDAAKEGPIDFNKVAATLEANATPLDFRRYVEPLFELLITGDLLAPGGDPLQDDLPSLSYNIFNAEYKHSILKDHAEVINRLIRRYRYLQQGFDEAMQKMLQYLNKWKDIPSQNEKLGFFVGIALGMQLISTSCIGVVKKEHLVKDTTAIDFVTVIFKGYIFATSLDALATLVRKSQLDSILRSFLPVGKQTDAAVIEHFEQNDLARVSELYIKRQQTSQKESFAARVTELMVGEHTSEEIVGILKEEIKSNGLSEQDVVKLLWDGSMKAVDWSTKADQAETQMLKHLSAQKVVFAAFCNGSKAQLALLLKIQLHCYEDARLTRVFHKILTVLYKTDVLSDSAILYWAEKGAAPQGKTMFLEQCAKLIAFLQESDDEEDEDEDDE